MSPHDVPRRRLVGKQAPQHPHAGRPAVRKVQAGGEEYDEEHEDEDEVRTREWMQELWEEDMRVWEHRELQKMMQDHSNQMLEGRCNPGGDPELHGESVGAEDEGR